MAVELVPDARLVDRVERQLAGAVGSASARVMVASVVQEEPLAIDDVIEILDEASQVRGYARALEEKSRSLEAATVELRAANEQLKSLDHLKDDFMSSVTHELRTPLTSIRALSELMLDAPDMEAGQREEFLPIVVSESERLSRLVNQVLDMAKIESGHAEWHNTDVDMRTLVANAVRAASELFREHGTVVEVSLPDQLPLIRADPDRLTQVMLNLLSNAAKFVPAEGGRVDVVLRTDAEGLVVRSATTVPGCRWPNRRRCSRSSARAGMPSTGRRGRDLAFRSAARSSIISAGAYGWNSEPGGGACFAFRLPIRPMEGRDAP